MASVVIGVAGGSGAGKTTVAERLADAIGRDRVALIQHDRYYRHHPALAFDERAALNFDHPDALETNLLVDHLSALKEGRTIAAPIYDYGNHARRSATDTIEPRRAIIVEGILIFADEALRRLFDVKLFVDTDPDVRFIRRLERDVAERGRSMRSVIDQYVATVKPMHDAFVEPTKRFADVIVPEGGHNDAATAIVLWVARKVT